MRIAQVIQVLNARAGGPLAVAGGLSRSLRAAGVDVTVVAPAAGHEPAAAESLRAQGVGVTLLDTLDAASMDAALAGSDVVHLHGVWDKIVRVASAAASRSGTPFVVTPHGMLTRWALAQKAWKKRLYLATVARPMLRRAAAIHLCSTFERRESPVLAALAPKVFVERNGIELGEFRELPPVGAFRTRFAIPAERPLIVFLGRCHPGKGLEYIMPAMARLSSADAMLAVVGPDPAGLAARLAAAANVPPERLLLCGHLSGRDRLEPLVDADVFVQPSDHENFGVAIVEAAAAGCPVVISDQVGVADEFAGHDIGSIVPRDPAAVAAAIDAWIGRRGERAAQRARSSTWAFDRFDFRLVAEEWRAKYESLARRPAQTARNA